MISEDQKRCSLYFTEGASDKEYHAQLYSKEGGFVVDFQYGRRGSALQSGTKTTGPLPYDKALKIYSKLVSEKMGKGYTPQESGQIFQSASSELNFTGLLPHLLNEITSDDADRYIQDPNWMLQLKYDGERRTVKISEDGTVIGSNKKGLQVALPQNIADEAKRLHAMFGPVTLDGEIIGNKLYVWDVLEIGPDDIRGRRAEERYFIAQGLSPMLSGSTNIEVCHAGCSTIEKRNLYNAYRDAGLEGVVFKEKNAPYVSGRPSSGGTQLKLKFWDSATLEVSMVNAQRSVGVQGYDENNKAVPLGNVTIPPNKPVPVVGDIVEVKYLYAYRNGSIYQPEYLSVRADQNRDDCSVLQLKYKVDQVNVMSKLNRP